MDTARVFTRAMELLDAHPRMAKAFLRPVANAPVLSKHLKVLVRAYMGATAFEAHDVDVERGRIGIGGVDEIMWSSRFLELFHEVLARHMGEQTKNEALYEIGHRGGYWEIDEAIRQARWAPRELMDLVERGNTIERLRTEPEMARFFELAMKMVLRIIINEGGWGSAEMEIRPDCVRVYLAHSKEAERLGASDRPVCFLSAGVIGGYSSRLLGVKADAREVECMAMGAERCAFQLDV